MVFLLLGRLNLLLSGTGFLLLDLCILLLLVILMWFGVWELVSFIVSFPMFIVVSVISFMKIVVHRRDEAIRGFREDPLVHPYKWLRPDLVPSRSISSV